MTPYAVMFGAFAFFLFMACAGEASREDKDVSLIRISFWAWLFCVIACAVCTDLIDGRLFG